MKDDRDLATTKLENDLVFFFFFFFFCFVLFCFVFFFFFLWGSLGQPILLHLIKEMEGEVETELQGQPQPQPQTILPQTLHEPFDDGHDSVGERGFEDLLDYGMWANHFFFLGSILFVASPLLEVYFVVFILVVILVVVVVVVVKNFIAFSFFLIFPSLPFPSFPFPSKAPRRFKGPNSRHTGLPLFCDRSSFLFS